MGAAASVANADNAPMACTLKGLPETIETAVYVREKWPIVSDRESDRDVVFLILAFLSQIIDPSGQAGRFLRYQRGSYLLADSPADMAPGECSFLGCQTHTEISLDMKHLNTTTRFSSFRAPPHASCWGSEARFQHVCCVWNPWQRHHHLHGH